MKNRRIQAVILGVSFFWLFFLPGLKAYGAEKAGMQIQGTGEDLFSDYMEEIDCQEMQEVMEDMLPESSFDFREAVEKSLSGEEIISWNTFFEAVKQALLQEFSSEKSRVVQLLVIAVAGALFINFSNVFKNNQVADTGYFITYLLMFATMSLSFYKLSQIASGTLENLLEFMKALLPAYFMAVAFSTGSATSLAFYETAMVLLTLAEVVLVKTMIPMIHIYFVISLTNYISREDYLSKAMKLLENGIRWTLKSLLGITAGYNFIQGMILPVADRVKNSMVLKTAKMLPGVGNAIGSVAETVFGAGVLVKNAVGTVGILAILLLISIPMAKIGFYCLFYKAGVAVIQPISDKRILECLEGACKGASLLLYLLFAGSAIFLLTIAIVMASTSQISW